MQRRVLRERDLVIAQRDDDDDRDANAAQVGGPACIVRERRKRGGEPEDAERTGVNVQYAVHRSSREARIERTRESAALTSRSAARTTALPTTTPSAIRPTAAA